MGVEKFGKLGQVFYFVGRLNLPGGQGPVQAAGPSPSPSVEVTATPSPAPTPMPTPSPTSDRLMANHLKDSEAGMDQVGPSLYPTVEMKAVGAGIPDEYRVLPTLLSPLPPGP